MKALAASIIGDAGELQFLRQPILQRLEGPLGAAPRLRRERPDVLDAQLLERPADLGRRAAIDLAAAFGGAEIMRPAIRVEAHRQAVLREDLVQRPEGRGRAFLLDEKGRIDRPGGVIQRDNEIKGGWPSSHGCREPS